MFKLRKEADYGLNVGPYLPWVQAFGHLMLEIYAERKTVRKTWKAFKESRREFEQIDLRSFEDMLLISLFLSEYDKLGDAGYPAAVDSAAARETDLRNQLQDELYKVIQELHNVTEERDRGLTAARNLEQSAKDLAAQNEDLERTIQSLEAGSEKFESRLSAANKELDQALREMESIREENAVLKREIAVLRDREDTWAKRIECMGSELDEARSEAGKYRSDIIKSDSKSPASMPDIAQERSPGGAHADTAPVPAIAKRGIGHQLKMGDTVEQVPPKKIGKWNAQRSKDGYYRLYRKIGGKVYSIYIGRSLDTEKARKRIAEKERSLLTSE